VFTIAGPRDLRAQSAPLTVKINGFSGSDLSHAQVVVTVLDDTGRPVSGITKDGFQARLNDTDATITGLSQGIDSSVPLTVVLAIDVSAGMSGAPIEQAKIAAAGFVDGLGPRDSVAVIAFNDAATVVQPFTLDHASAHATIDFLGTTGGAQLYEATLQSILQASASADTGRRAVVLLSGSTDTSAATPDQAQFAAQALGVPVFDIALGTTTDTAYLQALADVSGGQFTQAANPDGLVPLYQSLGELLREQYVLTLDASGVQLAEAQPATLSIVATAGERTGSDQRAVCPQRLCVTIDNIATGDKLDAARVVTANVVASDPVTSVTFLVDGQTASTATSSPYEFTFDPKEYGSGTHTLSVEVTAGSTSVRTDEVQVHLGSSKGGSQLLTLGAVIALVLVAALLVLFLLLRRRGRGESPKPVAPSDKPKVGPIIKGRGKLRLLEHDEAPAAPPAAPAAAPMGRLHVSGGPLEGQSFAIGSAPVSIGSGHRCTIRLPRDLEEGAEIAPEFARVWVRDNHLMVHELRRLTVVGPVGGRWEMLANGDTFSIGSCSFRFELGPGNKPADAKQEEPPPDILRSKAMDETPAPASAPALAPPQAAPADPAPPGTTPAPFAPPAQAAQESPVEPLPDIFRKKELPADASLASGAETPAIPTPLPTAHQPESENGEDGSADSASDSPPLAAAGP
jgi:VWFA-related protein